VHAPARKLQYYNRAVPANFEVLQREVYVTLLLVQDVTLLAAVAVLVVATRGRLGFDSIPRRKFG